MPDPDIQIVSNEAGQPTLRSLASFDRPMVGHFTDSAVVLDFLASSEHPRLAA